MKPSGTSIVSSLLGLALLLTAIAPAHAFTDEQYIQADRAIAKGIEYLRQSQGEDGSWTPQFGPAVTALAITVMLDQPNIDVTDPAVARGLAYILQQANEDGSIHAGQLPNYNTAICLSALARIRGNEQVTQVVRNGEQYLRRIQYLGHRTDEQGRKITEDHAFRGGFGYGRHGRPDGSNTQTSIQAMRDMGVDSDDPVFQEAVRYFTRLQGVPQNTMHGSKIVQDGGAIYATSVNRDLVGIPQSPASPEMESAARKGEPVSNLRTYGSMTYAMMKTYIYANLDRNDPRVRAAYDWIRRNFTVDQNPGMPEAQKQQGYYYYLMTMGRALDAWNAQVRDLKGNPIDWRAALSEKLIQLQADDGSWVNPTDRWAEGDRNLVTAYALIALNNVVGREP